MSWERPGRARIHVDTAAGDRGRVRRDLGHRAEPPARRGTEAPAEEFRAALTRRLAEDSWVVDGNYGRSARPLVWAAADTVVWLDLPRLVVLRSVLERTLRRIIRREELWNGNRERWSNFFDPRPANNVVLWSWTRHPRYARQMREAMEDPTWSHLTWVRLRSRDAVRAWLAEQHAARGS